MRLSWWFTVWCWLLIRKFDELLILLVVLFLANDVFSYAELTLKFPCEPGLSRVFWILILIWGDGIILLLLKKIIYNFCWFTPCDGVWGMILPILLLLIILRLFGLSLPSVASLFFLSFFSSRYLKLLLLLLSLLVILTTWTFPWVYRLW